MKRLHKRPSQVLVYQYLPQNSQPRNGYNAILDSWNDEMEEAEDAVLLVRCEDLVQSQGVHSSL